MAFYIAAFLIVWGVALFVAAPLTGGLRARAKRSREELEVDHWEHEHGLAVQGLRELEFDREMGKLSDPDYASLKASLEGRALQAMAAIQRFKEQDRAARSGRRHGSAQAARSRRDSRRNRGDVEASAGDSDRFRYRQLATAGHLAAWRHHRNRRRDVASGFVPQCGMRAPMAGNFCGECGTPLRGERVATRAS